MRLLEEAEHWKLIVKRQILEERMHELRKDKLKEQKLFNIRKLKEHTLGEVHELGEEFAARVSYLVLHCIFSCIFIHLQVFAFIAISYLYMYIF